MTETTITAREMVAPGALGGSADAGRGGSDPELTAAYYRAESAAVARTETLVGSAITEHTAERVVLKPRLLGVVGRRIEEALALHEVAEPYRAVEAALTAQLSAAAAGETALIADALHAARTEGDVSGTLLTDLADARRELERGDAVSAGIALLRTQHAAENTARLHDRQDRLESVLADYMTEVLDAADAAFGALHRAGVATAEEAIERGVGEAWLARKGLPERWLEAQHARCWIANAAEVGFGTPSLGSMSDPSQPRRALAGDRSIDFAEFWEHQFAGGRQFTEYSTPAEVLQWAASQKERPQPLTS